MSELRSQILEALAQPLGFSMQDGFDAFKVAITSGSGGKLLLARRLASDSLLDGLLLAIRKGEGQLDLIYRNHDAATAALPHAKAAPSRTHKEAEWVPLSHLRVMAINTPEVPDLVAYYSHEGNTEVFHEYDEFAEPLQLFDMMRLVV